MSTAEAKLNKLKVAELKEILAQVSLPQNGKKAELIAAILASPDAMKAAGVEVAAPVPMEEADEYDTPAAPEPIEPAPTAPAPTIVSPPSPTKEEPAAQVADAPVTTPAPTVTANPEDEFARRKARAARFGIPFVETVPKPKAAAPAPSTSKPAQTKKAAAPKPAVAKATIDDPEKLAARAVKFGSAKPAPEVHAPPVPVAVVDPEEEARRKKRAERFGSSQAPPEKKIKTAA